MNKEQIYERALKRIATFRENTEDYYGGVSIDYSAMVNDIIKIASSALLKAHDGRQRCEVKLGCCESCPETAFNLHLNDLKKIE